MLWMPHIPAAVNAIRNLNKNQERENHYVISKQKVLNFNTTIFLYGEFFYSK